MMMMRWWRWTLIDLYLLNKRIGTCGVARFHFKPYQSFLWRFWLLSDQSRAPLWQHLSQVGGCKLIQGIQALGKSGLCSRQLTGNYCKVVSQSTGKLNGAQPFGAMKMAKSYKEGTAANQRRYGSEGHMFKTRCQQGLFTAESPLKSTLPLVICIHNINSCVICIGWLHICFTCERRDMPGRRQPFKKVFCDEETLPLDWLRFSQIACQRADGSHYLAFLVETRASRCIGMGPIRFFLHNLFALGMKNWVYCCLVLSLWPIAMLFLKTYAGSDRVTHKTNNFIL